MTCAWCGMPEASHSPSEAKLCPKFVTSGDKKGLRAGWLMSSFKVCTHPRYELVRRISRGELAIRSERCSVCGEPRETEEVAP